MKLRVGVIGLGDAWETRYRPALRSLAEQYEVRAVCAEVALLADQAAREFGAVPVDGFRALCDREDVDAVLMLSSDWYGPLPILVACEAGKAIYCAAAALDLDPRRSREVRQRIEQSGVSYMAEFPRRYAPATLRLKELIATRLGRPRLLFCHRRRHIPKGGPNRHRIQPGPAAMREMMELVDWCHYVVGELPTSVVGVEHRTPAGEEDYQMMTLDFSPSDAAGSGPLAQISCGQYLHSGWHEAIAFRPPADLQVCCEHGVAFLDLPTGLTWFDEAGRHLESLESERPVGEQLLTQFHRSVTSLVRKTSDLEDAYHALQIVLSAKTSWGEGKRVELGL